MLFRVLKSLPGWPMSHRARGVTTVRLYIAGSCNCADLYQSFRMPRLSSPRLSRSKKICPPSSDIFNRGMPSRPSIGHGRAGFSFSCAMPRGSTASSVVLLYVFEIVVLPPRATKFNPVSPSSISSSLPRTPTRRPTLAPLQIFSPPPSYYSYQTRHLQSRRI
jgi:hypothetical protein